MSLTNACHIHMGLEKVVVLNGQSKEQIIITRPISEPQNVHQL